ncbi:hypothetical protein D3C81_1514440 [compost metagenome]
MDLLLADLAAGDVQFGGELFGHGHDFGRFLALAAFIGVETPRVLLAIAAQGIQLIGDLAVARVVGNHGAARLTDEEADIDTRQVMHGHYAHGQAQVSQHVVDLRRRCAFQQQAVGFA